MSATLNRITEHEMKLAEKIGRRAASRWSAVDSDDVISHLYLWIVENYTVVSRWRTEEGGESKLFVSLRREAAKYCAKEQTIKVGRPLRANNFYTVAMLERALPFIFEETPQTVVLENPVTGQTYGSGSPSDFGNAVAILADIKGTFYGLNREIREVLELRFRDGLTFEELGDLAGISKVAAKKRVDRALERLCDALAS